MVRVTSALVNDFLDKDRVTLDVSDSLAAARAMEAPRSVGH